MSRTAKNKFLVSTWFEQEGVLTYPEPRETVANLEIMLPDTWDNMSLDEQEGYLLDVAWEQTKFEWKVRSPYSRMLQLEFFMTTAGTTSTFPLVRFPKPDDWATMDKDARNEWIVDCVWGYARQAVAPVVRKETDRVLYPAMKYHVGVLTIDTSGYTFVSEYISTVQAAVVKQAEQLLDDEFYGYDALQEYCKRSTDPEVTVAIYETRLV